MNALTRLSAAPEKQPMADNTLKRPAPTARILAAVLGGIDHVIYVCDPTTHEILFVNEAATTVFGNTDGKKCFAAFQGLGAPCDFCTNDRILGANFGKTHVWESHNRLNGRWYQCHDRAVHWPDQRSVRCSMAIDITDSKQNEEALAQSEAFYRALSDSAKDFIFIITPEKRIQYVNQLCAERFGMTADEIIGKTLYELFPVNNAQRFSASVQSVFDARSTLSFESPVSLPGADLVWLDTKLMPLRNKDGTVTSVMGLSRDVTERRIAETTLKESEEKFRTLAEQSPNMIFINKDAKIVYVNRKSEEIMGYTRSELCSPRFDFLTLIAPECIELIEANYRKHLQGHEVSPTEFVAVTKSGTHIDVICSTRLIQYDGGPAILGTVTDITEQKQMRLEKERMQAQLIEAQKMEAIGTLTGGIAHDFNNILTGIRGFAQLALSEIDETSTIFTDLKQIETITERAGNLTRQLLLFGRRHPIELSTFNLNAAVESLHSMLQRLIGEHIAIQSTFQNDLWLVRADRPKFEQVLVNLVVNARDAMPDGGTIAVTTANVSVDEKLVSLQPQARPGRYVCLSVADTGVGIEKTSLDRIFEPFYTTKDASRGTGLGLAVVYGIVKQHHGWVRVESTPGQGATFTVYLPADFGEETKAPGPPQAVKEQAQVRGGRILLVEDEDAVREFSERALKSMGYTVFSAADSTAALAIFEREGGEFDVLFSDVVLPDKNGVELAKELVAKRPSLGIILASGYVQSQDQWAQIQKLTSAFLQKPYDMDEMSRQLTRLIDTAAPRP